MNGSANRSDCVAVPSLVAWSAGVLVLSGCSIYDVPLPGGADTGDNPMQGHGDVPRRPRPGAAVDGQGQRRHRGQGQARSSSRATSPRSRSRSRATSSCPTTPRPRSARPASSGEKFIQLEPPREPGQRQAVEQRRHRARPHRPQPRGRRGLRRARAAAQRRRGRPAQDDRLRAQQRLRRPRGRDPLGADPDPQLHGPARREQGVDRRRAREHQPAGRSRSASRTAPSRARWTTSRTPCARSTASVPTWSSCSRP